MNEAAGPTCESGVSQNQHLLTVAELAAGFALRMTVPEEMLYACLIEEQTSDAAFIQFYWARASHLGAAIEKSLDAARKNGLTNPIAREADFYDIENLECEVYPDADADVFFATTRYSFPPESSFNFPRGIIPSFVEDEEADDVDDLRSGYQRTKFEDGLIKIGVNVCDSDLLSVYERLLLLHKVYKTFWYLIHDHWGDAENQIYENPELGTAAAIIKHLRTYPHDSVQNGFVTLTAYLAEGATNVNISDHKRIVILTYSDSVAGTFEARLKSLGFSHDENLVSFDYRMHHWHYRPSESFDRADLIEFLVAKGFKPWSPTK
jgi:hypothetical protein